jgi:hypothetical protein
MAIEAAGIDAPPSEVCFQILVNSARRPAIAAVPEDRTGSACGNDKRNYFLCVTAQYKQPSP